MPCWVNQYDYWGFVDLSGDLWASANQRIREKLKMNLLQFQKPPYVPTTLVCSILLQMNDAESSVDLRRFCGTQANKNLRNHQ